MVTTTISYHKSSNELFGHHLGHGLEYAYDVHYYLNHHSKKGSLVIHYGHKFFSLWDLEIRKIKYFKENQSKSTSHGYVTLLIEES